jgi:hypothetical protein
MEPDAKEERLVGCWASIGLKLPEVRDWVLYLEAYSGGFVDVSSSVITLGGDAITTVSSSRGCEFRECELVTELERDRGVSLLDVVK